MSPSAVHTSSSAPVPALPRLIATIFVRTDEQDQRRPRACAASNCVGSWLARPADLGMSTSTAMTRGVVPGSTITHARLELEVELAHPGGPAPQWGFGVDWAARNSAHQRLLGDQRACPGIAYREQ